MPPLGKTIIQMVFQILNTRQFPHQIHLVPPTCLVSIHHPIMWNIVLTFKNNCTGYCYQISVVTLWKVLSCFPLLIIYYITCIQWSKYNKQITTNTFIFFLNKHVLWNVSCTGVGFLRIPYYLFCFSFF